MTVREYENQFRELSNKEKTQLFNEMSIDDRTDFLDLLPKDERDKFIKDIRTQAVKDFWTHEQALIKEGRCTRDWTPEQVEDILNISEKTGVMSINGEAAVDLNGRKYYGHHMKNVSEYPEYAGDWRNIEALDYEEHYFDAHGGNTKSPTNAFYDPDNKVNVPIDDSRLEYGQDMKTGEGYIETRESIFKSDREIDAQYSRYGEISDGERLALKNVELSKDVRGSSIDYDRALDVAERYNCKDFSQKFEIGMAPTKESPKQEFRVVEGYEEKDDVSKIALFVNDKGPSDKDMFKEMGHILQAQSLNEETKMLGEYISKGGEITVVNVDNRIKDDLCQRLQEEKMGYLQNDIPGKESALFIPTSDVDKLKEIEADLLKDKGLNCVQMSINDLCQNAEKADELVSRKNPTQIIEIRGLTEENAICLQDKCKGISQDFQIGMDQDGNGRYNFAIKESQAFSMNPEVKDFAKSYLDATVDTYGAKNEIKSDILYNDKEFAAGLENLSVERGDEPKYIVGKNCNDRYIEVTDSNFSLYSYSTKDNEITRNCLETVDRSSPDYLYRLTACSMDIKDCELVDKNGLKDNLLNEHHAVNREDLNIIRKDEMVLTDKINEIVKTKMQKDPKFIGEKDCSVLLGEYMNQCKSILDDISNNINPKGLTHDQVDDLYNFIDNSSLNCKEYRDCKKVFDRFDSDIYQCNDRDKHFELKMEKNPIKEISKDSRELERIAR